MAGVYYDFTGYKIRYPQGLVIPAPINRILHALTHHHDMSVIVLGETGSGKGVIARRLVDMRREKEGQIPFVSLNCAQLNADVADSMIFGHKRGSFTGAYADSIGAVGEADGGVLFLDEIHSLGLNMQGKLLRLLDDGVYMRIGESRERTTHFQLIVATNRDILDMVAKGDFLPDLIMRIQGVEIKMPALRHRKDEIPDLIGLHYLGKNIHLLRDDFDALVKICSDLYWPGNIRQLIKALDVTYFNVKAHGGERFSDRFVVTDSMCSSLRPEPVSAGNVTGDDIVLIEELLREFRLGKRSSIQLEELMSRLESGIIHHSLRTRSSVCEVMSTLGLSRNQLDFKRRKYNLMSIS